MDGEPTRNTATLLFSFLLSFLGITCVTIFGGLIWQRVASRWRGHHGLPTLAGGVPFDASAPPKLWDVCVQKALSAARLSDTAWEQLRPLALRVTPAAADTNGSGIAGLARPAKWKLSPVLPTGVAFQTHEHRSDAVEDGVILEGCQAAIAVLIAYPSRPIKASLDELALGTAHMLCAERDDG